MIYLFCVVNQMIGGSLRVTLVVDSSGFVLKFWEILLAPPKDVIMSRGRTPGPPGGTSST